MLDVSLWDRFPLYWQTSVVAQFSWRLTAWRSAAGASPRRAAVPSSNQHRGAAATCHTGAPAPGRCNAWLYRAGRQPQKTSAVHDGDEADRLAVEVVDNPV